MSKHAQIAADQAKLDRLFALSQRYSNRACAAVIQGKGYALPDVFEGSLKVHVLLMQVARRLHTNRQMTTAIASIPDVKRVVTE